MAVFRGLRHIASFWASAERVKASGHYSEQNDTSVLFGEPAFSRLYGEVVDKTIGVVCDLRGDYLIYGWRPWLLPMALLGMINCGAFITTLMAALTTEGTPIHWYWDWPGVTISGFLLYIGWWWYPRSRFSHFIIFDRRNQLIHLPRWFSHQQDSIRWQEADLGVVDMPSGLLSEHIATFLTVVPPPLTLQQQGTKPWYRFFKYHEDDKDPKELKRYGGYPVDGSEAVFRFVVDFMTRPPEQCIALDAMPTFEVELEYKADNDFPRFIHKYRYFFAMIDPERLPTQPNWIRDEQGHWQQVRPAVRARFGWFGLWNRSYTLPPHLRGTQADPACKDDPAAPLPVARWYSQENTGTGELIGQPAAVLAAVLRGEGMPNPESLAQTRLPEGGWPGPGNNWWYQQFEAIPLEDQQAESSAAAVLPIAREQSEEQEPDVR